MGLSLTAMGVHKPSQSAISMIQITSTHILNAQATQVGCLFDPHCIGYREFISQGELA